MDDGIGTFDDVGIDDATCRIPGGLTLFGRAPHETNDIMAVRGELGDECRTDETTGPGNHYSHVVRLRLTSFVHRHSARGWAGETFLELRNDDWYGSHDGVGAEEQSSLDCKCRLIVQPLRPDAGDEFRNHHGDEVV